MTKKPDQLPDDVPPPAAARKDRRQAGRGAGGRPRLNPKALGAINHDDLGNAVWEWRVDVPRRRDDDPTIDLIDCLDVDGMSLEDEKSDQGDDEAFNPYNKSR